MPDLTALVKEIDGLYEKATKGPWTARIDETSTLRDEKDNQLAIFTHLHTKTGGRRDSDEVAKNTRLSAALVNAWPTIRQALKNGAGGV